MDCHVRIAPLELGPRSVRFQWELRPAHPAWTRGEFTLEYEDDIDLRTMPRALLWTVFLGCTHLGAVTPNRLDTVKRGNLQYLPDELRDPIRPILEASAPYDAEDDADVHEARVEVVELLTELRSCEAPFP